MELDQILNFVFNIDRYLSDIIRIFGPLSYLILFIVIFLETGIVLAPFLPGDSLLFIVGVFTAHGSFNLALIYAFLVIAAILGDSVNYVIGSYFGENVFSRSRLFKREYLEKTKKFYAKHGGKTIFFARFIPIIRTFAPFVAGVGKMPYKKFISYNVIGGIVWVSFFLLAGYFFGEIPFVKENFSLVVLIIILISLLPLILGILKNIKNKNT